MRGSPLLRTLLLIVGLLLAGWGMLRFVDASSTSRTETHQAAKPLDLHRYGLALKLSAPVKSIDLKSRAGHLLFHAGASDPLNGEVSLDPADPAVFITVAWSETASPGQRFLKLTLEPPGKPTLVHYFEAPGDFEDVWELPAE